MTDAVEAPTDSTDAAWVRIPTPQPVDELRASLNNTELLLRLNPYYTFQDFRRSGARSFHVRFRNDSNEQDLEVDLTIEAGSDGTITLRYDRGIKERTVFSVAPASSGGILTITDAYDRLPPEERDARMAEVDRSLPAWGEALRVYFCRIRRWSWLPGWRRYIHGPWMRMAPRARRIVWLLWLISIVEFVFFLFVLLIWVIENR